MTDPKASLARLYSCCKYAQNIQGDLLNHYCSIQAQSLWAGLYWRARWISLGRWLARLDQSRPAHQHIAILSRQQMGTATAWECMEWPCQCKCGLRPAHMWRFGSSNGRPAHFRSKCLCHYHPGHGNHDSDIDLWKPCGLRQTLQASLL